MKSVKMKITPEGMTIEAEGYTGGECLTDLEKFVKNMEKLGVKVVITNQRKKSAAGMVSSTPGSKVSMK